MLRGSVQILAVPIEEEDNRERLREQAGLWAERKRVMG
jgi:hypothetical protein